MSVHSLRKSPGRGKYDRDASPSERLQRQRDLILSVAQSALIELRPQELTVALVLELTGLGRNTFYSHFTGVDHLAQQVVDEAVQRLRAALEGHELEMLTPMAGARALAERWFSAWRETPGAFAVVLNCSPEVVRALLEQDISGLRDAGVRAGAFADTSEVRLAALVGAGMALLVHAGRQAAEGDAGTNSTSGGPSLARRPDVERYVSTLADVLLKALR